MRHFLLALFLALVQVGSFCHADVTLRQIFKDNMVIQRNKPIKIWGTADIGETVTVTLNGKTGQVTTGSDGNWLVTLEALPEGGPYVLTVQGNNTIQLQNVLVGDVFLVSGQSNAEYLVDNSATNLSATRTEADSLTNIRVFTVEHAESATLQDELPAPVQSERGYWEIMSASTVDDVTALGYFFARDVHLNEGVPVGVVSSSVGGTEIEKWNPAQEAGHYNIMIYPLMPLALRGILWYQGESDAIANFGPFYEGRLQNLITTWREGFGNTDLPFFVVQIANYVDTWGGDWATVRDAQYRALELWNTGIVTAVDIGEPYNLHPDCKEILAYRLSLWTQNFLYSNACQFTGPLVDTITREGSSMRVTFAYTGSGLVVVGSLTGFEVAGADRNYVTANAVLDGTDSLLISAASVSTPVWVRYAWDNNPTMCLYNDVPLPALPFRGSDGFVGPIPAFGTPISTPVPSPTPATGQVVLDLSLDEGSGSITSDSSGCGNDGTISGAAWVTGYDGDGLDFDGVDDRVECPADSTLNADNFTAAAWINLDSTASINNLISRMGMAPYLGWKVFVQNDGRLHFAWWYGDGSSFENLTALSGPTVLSTGVWHHIALVVENGYTISFYVDGVLDASANMDTLFSYPDRPLVIGNTDCGFYNGATDGVMDDVFFYNAALSASQVAVLANGVTPTSAPSATPTPTSTTGSSELTLSQIFQDNMVLTRNQPIKIWGTASIGEVITVSLAGNTGSATTGSDGKWMVTIEPLPAGGPYVLTVEGNTTIELTNIMLGDVYLASGQSNMRNIVNTDAADVTAATNEGAMLSNVRVFTVEYYSTNTPQDDLYPSQNPTRGCWWSTFDKIIPWYPALPYFFAKEVHLAEGIPVGIIASSVGGTAIEKWNPAQEAGHYNAMIYPLMPFTLKGIIWWQGEGDAWYPPATLYEDRMKNLITTWRDGFGNPELPFFIVQLENYIEPQPIPYLPVIREAQYLTLELSNVGLAAAIDVGESDDVHPKCKEILGKRLCYWAENFIYGKPCPFTGPLVKTISREGIAFRVTFAYVGTGLTVPGGTLTGFEIAGADESYVTANASLDGTNAILISNTSLSSPVWVRYAWDDDPPISLFNSDNFVALPFRGTNGFVGLMPKFTSVTTVPPSSATPTPTSAPTSSTTPTPTIAPTFTPNPIATITPAVKDPDVREDGIRGFRTSPESLSSIIECIDDEEVIIELGFGDAVKNIRLDIYSVDGMLITSINQDSKEMDLNERVIRWKPDRDITSGTYIFLLKVDGVDEGTMLGVVIR